MRKLLDFINEWTKNRHLILFSGVFVLFLMLAVRLYSLQVLHGQEYVNALTTTIARELTVPASRGNIYDAYGRPLATNLVAFSVKLDDSTKIDFSQNRNQLILDLAEKLDKKSGVLNDTLPITKTKPYSFALSEDEEKEFKQSIGLSKKQLDFTADETIDFLSQKYEIPEDINEALKRKIISMGIEISDKNLMIASLVELLESSGETIVDDIPITKTSPYSFTFNNNTSKETDWKKSIGISKDIASYDGEKTLEYLAELFEVPQCFGKDFKRNIISIRYALHLERYRKYQPVTVALDINDKTVAALEEYQNLFPGVTIDTDSLRYYNEGEYFSHILGYIRKIDDKEYEENKQYGYKMSDLFGKGGIEKLKEHDLRGTDGEMLVEVDALGKRINTIETTPPVSGNDVFLTIDSKLQKATFDIMEQTLADALIRKMTTASRSDYPVTIKQVFSSMVNGNAISIKEIASSTSGEQFNLYKIVLEHIPDFDISNEEHEEEGKQILINSINSGQISGTQIILVMIEQGIITADENYLNKIKTGGISPLGVVVDKLKSGELRPSDTKTFPCTGSVVVSDVKTGNVLSLVTYPSYDNNMLVNNFNNEYYNSLLDDFVTSPLVNRPLSEKKAPGSTFKMVIAMAGLEEGFITPNSIIRDLGTFTKAGLPYARCWINSGRGSHGNVDVATSLEVSCNYFYYELSYRMGNYTNGKTLESIGIMNEYMAAFGLNQKTGIEIGETEPNMASPQYKESIMLWQNPDATSTQTRWTDGDTIRAAIGQSVNNYTTAHMNKYIATLANGGTQYKLHLIDSVKKADGTVKEYYAPEIEYITDFNPTNVAAVHKGMYQVTSGSRGTLRGVFKDFPVKVAAKSGTAQEVLTKSSHTTFVAFAPYEDPQISISVMIPYGEMSNSPSAVVAREVIREYMGLNYQGDNTYMENILAE